MWLRGSWLANLGCVLTVVQGLTRPQVDFDVALLRIWKWEVSNRDITIQVKLLLLPGVWLDMPAKDYHGWASCLLMLPDRRRCWEIIDPHLRILSFPSTSCMQFCVNGTWPQREARIWRLEELGRPPPPLRSYHSCIRVTVLRLLTPSSVSALRLPIVEAVNSPPLPWKED